MRPWAWRLAWSICAALAAGGARGQSLEGVLMPGQVIAGHAKVEQQCDKCHVKFNKAAQDTLCIDCHKEVGRDLRARSGYHGRIRIDACRSCHTDHKGRDVNIAAFDARSFDHAKTDFALAGAHAKVECAKCHVAGRKYREAPGECNECHRKDDKHKGSLGARCADCHAQANWKETRFDHAKAQFPLIGKHVDVKCRDCHTTEQYKDAPQACVSCHRKDDAKQHRGRLGEKCETCHNAKEWKDVAAFEHDRDTKYPLRGRHRTAKCESCHTAAAAAMPKLQSTCVACHRPDDKHERTLGTACGDCHTERNWREAKFDHELSVFKLRGKHRDVDCAKCHRDPKSFKGAPLDCVGCHRKDDPHKSRYGEKCEGCHTDRGWKDVTFRHDVDTKYRLFGKHREAKCDSCHVGYLYRDKLRTDCHSCHRKDDKHREQLGRECEKCHDSADWKKTVRFDHDKSHFPLLGRHARVECGKCHETAAFKDARSDCASCHRKDDSHKRLLGLDCGRCHNARAWQIWDFDHARQTKFALESAHARTSCVTCHKAPGEDAKPAPLPLSCNGCHRPDDPHAGEYGAQCERCHSARSWRDIQPFRRNRAAWTPYRVAAESRGTLQ